jgi:signal transduction histidine kinase
MIKFSPPETSPKYAGRMTRIGMTTLMVITHGAVAVAILMLTQLVADWHFLLRLPAVMIMGGGLGFLLTYYVLNDIERVETALYRLGKGLRVQPLPTRNREPIRFMMEHVNTLIAREQELVTMRQQLSGQIGEAAAQEERSRLARDLHDSIKQQIFSINISAAAVQARWEHDPAGAQKALADVRQSAQEAMVEMRAMLQQLAPAPLEKVGLTQALRDQCEALEYRSGAVVRCEIGALPEESRLPPGSQEALFRIAQEALTNIARHARAKTVSLRLEMTEDGAEMEIKDDGQGFERGTEHVGMGLMNMEARARGVGGTLDLLSAPAAGTQIQVHVPFVQIPLAQLEDEPADDPIIDEQISQAKTRLMGGSVGAFISSVCGFVAVLSIGRDDLPVWLSLLSIAFGIGGSIGFVVSSRLWLSGLRVMRSVERQLQPDDKRSLLLRYHLSGTLLLLPIFVFTFVPGALVTRVGSELAMAIGLSGLAATCILGVHSFQMYDRYIRGLTPSQLKREAQDDFTESGWNRWSWIWALPMLMNLAFDFPPQFPPLTNGDWLDFSLPGCGVLFLIAGIWYSGYHSRVRRRIENLEVMS